MKYPIFFLLVSVFLGAFVFVILGFAAFAEIKDLLERKTNVDALTAD